MASPLAGLLGNKGFSIRPDYDFTAANLPLQADGSPVSFFANAGLIGSAQDLYLPEGASPAVYLPYGGPGGTPAIRLAADSVLQTRTHAPAAYVGNGPRTVLTVFRPSMAGANQDVLGWGSSAGPGQGFGIMQYQTVARLDVRSANGVLRSLTDNGWVSIVGRGYQDADAFIVKQRDTDDENLHLPSSAFPVDTVPAPFRLGGGSSTLGRTAPYDFADVKAWPFVSANLLTEIRNYLVATYNLTI